MKYIFSIISIFIVTIACGQQTKEEIELALKNKIKTVTIWETKYCLDCINPVKWKMAVSAYDSIGRITSDTSYSIKDGKPFTVTTYTYKGNQMTLIRKQPPPYDSQNIKVVYTYDNKKRIITWLTITDKDTLNCEKYSYKKDLLIKRQIFSLKDTYCKKTVDGCITNEKIYQYNSKKQLIQIREWHVDSKEDTTIYEYKNGLLFQTIKHDGYGHGVYYLTKYDEKGNEIWYERGINGGTVAETRQTTYNTNGTIKEQNIHGQGNDKQTRIWSYEYTYF